MDGRLLSSLTAAAAALLLAAAPAGAQSGTYLSILPFGQGEGVNALELGAATATGQPPATFTNQLGLFERMIGVRGAIPAASLEGYFKPAPLDAPAGAAVREPRPGSTIARDAFNVPYVTGTTRADLYFGVGYAQGEDRMFLMEVLRHTARGRLTELIGPGAGTLEMDAAQLEVTDYGDNDLREMLERTRTAGPSGAEVVADLEAYAAGINAFIAAARTDPDLMPGEYAALGKPLRDWDVLDSVAILGLLNGYYGLGGGGELKAAAVLNATKERFGVRGGRRVYEDLRRREDPEAPTVVRERFPFDATGRRDLRSAAIPDAGSVVTDTHLERGSAGASASASRSVLLPGFRLKPHASNAMLVGAKEAEGGRSLLVAGPQVGFFSPAILHEVAYRGPGVHVRGAAVPGAGIYPIAGRGEAYAWSVTTAQGDLADTFAERLCEPDGSRPTLASEHYLRRDRCLPFRTLREELSWDPGPADLAADPAAQPYRGTITVTRSVHGPVIARGRVRGNPVAFVRARSSWRNEHLAAIGLHDATSGLVSSPQQFQRAIAQVSGSYNWFYADAEHIAYVQSGLYPRRARGTDPDLPTWGTGRWDWRGFDSTYATARTLPFERLPQALDPPSGMLVSWNNKQAPGWRASDADWQYGSVHRSERLSDRVSRAIRGPGTLTLGGLAAIMGDAGTVDLRGQEVLPWLLEILRRGELPASVRPVVDALQRWEHAGAHRMDADRDGAYEHSAGVALLDAWWPRVVRDVFAPVLGEAVIERATAINPFDELPKNSPDTWYYGWYSHVEKDLRSLLGRRVRGPLSRRYCGRGSLTRCRAALLDSLALTARELGPLDAVRVPSTCPVTTPATCDQLAPVTAGGAATPPSPWQDRGSYGIVAQPAPR